MPGVSVAVSPYLPLSLPIPLSLLPSLPPSLPPFFLILCLSHPPSPFPTSRLPTRFVTVPASSHLHEPRARLIDVRLEAIRHGLKRALHHRQSAHHEHRIVLCRCR